MRNLPGRSTETCCETSERCFGGLELDPLRFEQVYTDAGGRKFAEYALPYDETITLVSGYNVQMRHAIVKRWRELETKVAPTPQLSRSALIATALLAANEQLEEGIPSLSSVPYRIMKSHA